MELTFYLREMDSKQMSKLLYIRIVSKNKNKEGRGVSHVGRACSFGQDWSGLMRANVSARV